MAGRRHIFQCAVVILTVCGVALGGQSPKGPALPPGVEDVEAPPWESTAAKKSPRRGATPVSPPALSAQQIFNRVSPSVMVVESLNTKGSVTAFGSGVVIASGRVITNRHVIEEGISFRVEHGGKKWPAKLIRVDLDHDLAELSVIGLGAPWVHARDSSMLAVGEKVYAIGAPEGLELTISEGLISGLRDFGKDRVIQTSAAISPGSSGGGLFDAQGRLVGITTFYLKEGQSLNFALPAEWTLALDSKPIKAPPAVSENSPAMQALLLYLLGERDSKAGKYSQAITAYQQALRLEPDFEIAWVGLSRAYNEIKRPEKGINALKHSLRLNPGNSTNWALIGVLYGEVGRRDLETDAARKSVHLDADNASGWIVLMDGYMGLEQFESAVSAARVVIRLEPSYSRAWESLGVAYAQLGDYEKAVGAELKAVELEPDNPSLWLELGLTFKLNGQQSEIMRVYRKLKKLNPAMAEELLQRADLS